MIELPLVVMRGGLGNQLFQIAYQIASQPKAQVYLDLETGYSERQGETTLRQFQLPDRVFIFENPKFRWKIHKRINFRIMTLGNLVAENPSLKSILTVFESLSSILYSLILQKKVRIRASIGNGFDARIASMSQINQISIGFFQTYKWLEDPRVFTEMKSLRLMNPSRELVSLQELAQKTKPTIIHVRLGDYLDDSSRGTLSREYYEKGIKKIEEKIGRREIWIFSDDVELARVMFESMHVMVRWYSDAILSDAQTFELMRHGHAYVIGNSTFSWWAATLSYSQNPIVVAPVPWFRSSPIPRCLLWPHWEAIPATFNEKLL